MVGETNNTPLEGSQDVVGETNNTTLEGSQASPTRRSGKFRTKMKPLELRKYEGWNFNSGNYLFTTDTK